jgi:adenylate cyclase class IV
MLNRGCGIILGNMDYSIRIPATKERARILNTKAVSKRMLSRIKDYVFKPRGTSLADFHPDTVCVRLREFLEGDKQATLVKIVTTQTDAGYTDTKEEFGEGSVEELVKNAEKLGYEKWGEIATVSTEYDLGYAQVLSQELSTVGTFLKIESDTQDGLTRTLKLLKASEGEKIVKNAAVLLGEKLGLIKGD